MFEGAGGGVELKLTEVIFGLERDVLACVAGGQGTLLVEVCADPKRLCV